ncbi:hypothetical protein C8F04DRAFT_1274550 [Mycena alexandri]|uniref:Uncharacterized protein n=1 Tax=Mycena alexandri TaxID=1745969 RepID=A0AAD6S591_9AGAR|nr:hypothetical protein C8F04DRAFT_1274550 [Mycena alexandri]
MADAEQQGLPVPTHPRQRRQWISLASSSKHAVTDLWVLRQFTPYTAASAPAPPYSLAQTCSNPPANSLLRSLRPISLHRQIERMCPRLPTPAEVALYDPAEKMPHTPPHAYLKPSTPPTLGPDAGTAHNEKQDDEGKRAKRARRPLTSRTGLIVPHRFGMRACVRAAGVHVRLRWNQWLRCTHFHAPPPFLVLVFSSRVHQVPAAADANADAEYALCGSGISVHVGPAAPLPPSASLLLPFPVIHLHIRTRMPWPSACAPSASSLRARGDGAECGAGFLDVRASGSCARAEFARTSCAGMLIPSHSLLLSSSPPSLPFSDSIPYAACPYFERGAAEYRYHTQGWIFELQVNLPSQLLKIPAKYQG